MSTTYDGGRQLGRLTIHDDAQQMIDRARTEGIETVWDRLRAQEPQCGYCQLGLSCRNCAMGPCRIDPFGEGPQKGVCGADADVIVARNLGRTIAAGASSHSDHGRDILEVFAAMAHGETSGYQVTDEAKLRRVAGELGVATEGRSVDEVAVDLADVLMADYGSAKGSLSFVARVPAVRRDKWAGLGITPRGIDRENVEMMHRTHMGVDNDYVNLLLHALRTALSDGWGGSMIATEFSDIMFGTPSPVTSKVNLGVLKTDQVNIAMHGHNPLLSDVIVAAAQDPELLELARSYGATGINVVGLCCTGNEMLMRKGVPMAGNHLMQELVLVTGALEAMVVDYQCIMPSVVDVAKCYHTQVISTSDKAKFPGATHVSFDPHRGAEIAREIVRMAVEAYPERNQERVRIPVEPVEMMGGFSVEAILGALGGTPQPLVDAIVAGTIRGAVAVVGCNNPKLAQDLEHIELTRKLIENDILVLVTGCAAVANGKAGQMMPESADAGRARAARGVRVARHPARAAHGLVRGQQPGHALGGRAGQRHRRGHRPAAARRSRARVVLGEGGRHRRLRRRLGRHHRARRAAAHLRQRQRGESAGRRARRCRRREVRRRTRPLQGRAAHPSPPRSQASGSGAAVHRVRRDPR